jgi:uncharacterized protein (TIGR00255 family)
MVLKSMTGYGRAEVEKQGRIWTVELRSVNNRFLDSKIKLPRDYGVLEDSIRKMIGQYHQRGRVDLNLSVSGDFSDLVQIRVDNKLGLTYKRALEKLAADLELESQIDLRMIATLPDVLTRQQQTENVDELWSYLEETVHEALQSCQDMRGQEGAALTHDLTERLQFFTAVLDEIEQQIPELVLQRKKVLHERLEKLLGGVDLDPMRLAQEVAILADKSDVTEEMVRLKSHINQFQGLLQVSEPVGRKLDFLIQEFLREVNTLASKINDASIAHKAVVLKSELEKMREQVQNIE